MRRASVWATISVLLFIFGSSKTAPSSAPVVKLAGYHIVKKPIHTVSDKFLSFTADPNCISHVAECSSKDGNTTLKMAKSLAPAYFRIAGVDSNRLVFQSNPNSNPSDNISKSKIFSVTNSDWLKWNNFLSEAGMNIIACVSGETEPSSKSWDLSNILELITFSDKHNISLDWQLGYELQKLASPQGKLMGRDVEKLRKILDVFPRYRQSLIIGPDMTSFRTQNDAVFVRSYLSEAKDSLNVFTWHPFSKSSEDGEILEMLSNGMTSMDNYLWIKDGLMKSSSKGIVPRKPIWIAESENTETVSNLSDSMTWIMRMGSAARLGASVYLRRPHLLSFYEPTPEYWTAILFKSLVGRTVLDIKHTSGNGTNKLQMFTHCTKFIEKPEESIINPEISYDPGSITVYGANMAPESTRISFKIGYKVDETAHLYILTEDTSGDFPKTLLNKQSLYLSSDNELPIISPRVRESPKYLLIPARSIFFVVFPNTKCRSCNEYDILDASKVKIRIPEEEDADMNTSASDAPEAMEDENDRDNVYVNFAKHNENSQIPTGFSVSPDNSNFKLDTKFVISSDDTWMNRFPEELKDAMKKEKDPLSDTKDKEKAQQYRLLAQAMTGKRAIQNIPSTLKKSENPATRFVYDEEHSELTLSKRAPQNSGRVRRSMEPVPGNENQSKEIVLQSDPQTKELIIDNSLKENLVNESKPKEIVSQNDTQPIESIYDDYLEENNEATTNPTSEYSDYQNFALYVYDQVENETNSNETGEPNTFTMVYAVPLFEKEFEEAKNRSEFRNTIPVIAFVKESALDLLIEAARNKNKIKRETMMENFTASEFSSGNNLNQVDSTQNTTMDGKQIEGTIKDVIGEVVGLVTKFFILNTLPQASVNESFNSTNHSQIYNRILSQFMFNEIKFPKYPKKSLPTENSTSAFDLEDDSESDKFQQALKDFDRFKRWAESIPADELKLKQSLDDNHQMEAQKSIMKREDPLKSANLESSMNPNPQNLVLYVFDRKGGEFHFSETQKRSTPSQISAIPLNEESLQEAIEENQFRETIPILTFLPKSTLQNMLKAANTRNKRETTLDNSTNSQMFENSSNLSTTPPSSNSSNETATQTFTYEYLLKEVNQLSDDTEFLTKEAKQLSDDNEFLINEIKQLSDHIVKEEGKVRKVLMFGNSTNLSTTPSSSNSSNKTATQPFTYESLLKEMKQLSNDSEFYHKEAKELSDDMQSLLSDLKQLCDYIVKEEGKIRKQLIQNGSLLEEVKQLFDLPEFLLNVVKQLSNNTEFIRNEVKQFSDYIVKEEDKITKNTETNTRNKREITLDNSTNSQMFENATNLSTTPPSSNSSNETASQPISSKFLLKEAKQLSNDIIEEVGKIMKQIIQNDTETQLNNTQKPNLQQTNASITDLAKESDNSKIQRDLREVDDDSEIDSNVLGARKVKTIEKPSLRPVSPFPKKPKHAKSKSVKNIKVKSSDHVQLNHQDSAITSLPETDPVVSSKRQTEDITLSSQGKSLNVGKIPKSADEPEDGLLSYDSDAATKLHSKISENLREPVEVTEAPSKIETPHSKKKHYEESSPVDLGEHSEAGKAPPHKDISPKVGAPHLEKLHSEESSPVKQVPIEDDYSFKLETRTPSNTPAIVRKPLLRPATLADLEKERSKHHKTVPQPIKRLKMTPEQIRASVEQKRKALLQRYSDRLKEIRSLLHLSAVPTPHTRATRNADVVDETKEFFSHVWDEVRNWEPSKDWERGKSWIAKESKKISDMVTQRNKRHADGVTTEEDERISSATLDSPFIRGRLSVGKQDPASHEAFNKAMQALVEKQNRRIKEVVEERKKAMIARAKAAHYRNPRDMEKNIEKLKELRERRQRSSNESYQKLARHAKELKEKITGRISHRNKRDLQSINHKIQELHQKKNQQRSRFYNKIDSRFPARQSEMPSILATKMKPAKPYFMRKTRDVQTVQNKIQEMRQKKQDRRNSLHKKSEIERAPSNGNLEPFTSPTPLPTLNKKPETENSPRNEHLEPSSNQTPIPRLHQKQEVKHASSSAPLDNSGQPPLSTDNKLSKIEQPPHQVADKTSKKLRNSPQINKEKSHHRLPKRDVNENKLLEEVTSSADLQKNLHLHLFADPELNTPQSMLDGMKYDDLDRLKRSLSDNEIFDADDEAAIKLKNNDPERYHELKLNKMNEFVLEPVTSTPKPSSIDVKIDKGISKFQTYEIKATASSQENQTCQLSYNVFKYFLCLTEKFFNTYVRV